MTTLIANELRKLRTIRGPWLLLAGGPVLVIVGVAGEVAGGADLTQPQTAIHAVAHAGVVSLLTLTFGITAVAGEYRHKTITDTYLATPRRGRVIAAKFAVYTAVGAVFGLMLAATAVIATALAWIALVEGLIGELISDLEPWLPFAGGQALGRLPGAPDISRWAGGLLLAGYAVVFAALALATSIRLYAATSPETKTLNHVPPPRSPWQRGTNENSGGVPLMV